MQNIKERIDHALDVFRRHERRDVIIGLTHADWDELCAVVIDSHERNHEDPALTLRAYMGVPIIALSDGKSSFIAHDFGAHAERRFPIEVLEEV